MAAVHEREAAAVDLEAIPPLDLDRGESLGVAGLNQQHHFSSVASMIVSDNQTERRLSSTAAGFDAGTALGAQAGSLHSIPAEVSPVAARPSSSPFALPTVQNGTNSGTTPESPTKLDAAGQLLADFEQQAKASDMDVPANNTRLSLKRLAKSPDAPDADQQRPGKKGPDLRRFQSPRMLNPNDPSRFVDPAKRSNTGYTDEELACMTPEERARKERNRLAARKCRARKVAWMAEIETELSAMSSRNDELAQQVATLKRLYAKELRLREALKVVVQACWDMPGGVPLCPGYSVEDFICALESGNQEIHALLTTLAWQQQCRLAASPYAGGAMRSPAAPMLTPRQVTTLVPGALPPTPGGQPSPYMLGAGTPHMAHYPALQAPSPYGPAVATAARALECLAAGVAAVTPMVGHMPVSLQSGSVEIPSTDMRGRPTSVNQPDPSHAITPLSTKGSAVGPSCRHIDVGFAPDTQVLYGRVVNPPEPMHSTAVYKGAPLSGSADRSIEAVLAALSPPGSPNRLPATETQNTMANQQQQGASVQHLTDMTQQPSLVPDHTDGQQYADIEGDAEAIAAATLSTLLPQSGDLLADIADAKDTVPLGIDTVAISQNMVAPMEYANPRYPQLNGMLPPSNASAAGCDNSFKRVPDRLSINEPCGQPPQNVPIRLMPAASIPFDSFNDVSRLVSAGSLLPDHLSDSGIALVEDIPPGDNSYLAACSNVQAEQAAIQSMPPDGNSPPVQPDQYDMEFQQAACTTNSRLQQLRTGSLLDFNHSAPGYNQYVAWPSNMPQANMMCYSYSSYFQQPGDAGGSHGIQSSQGPVGFDGSNMMQGAQGSTVHSASVADPFDSLLD